MKKAPHRKSAHRGKTLVHRAQERPMEFNRDWQDLEMRNSQSNIDWMGLAAQLGVSSSGAFDE